MPGFHFLTPPSPLAAGDWSIWAADEHGLNLHPKLRRPVGLPTALVPPLQHQRRRQCTVDQLVFPLCPGCSNRTISRGDGRPPLPTTPHCHYRTSGLNQDGTMKHDYPSNEWRLVPSATGTGNGTRPELTTAPTIRLVCFCCPLNPGHRKVALLFGAVRAMCTRCARAVQKPKYGVSEGPVPHCARSCGTAAWVSHPVCKTSGELRHPAPFPLRAT